MGRKEAAEWMRFAEDDLEAAHYLLGMPKRRLEIICYHCQQCAEKALKGLYALGNLDTPRTHDFRVLVTGLSSLGDGSDLYDELSFLQPFAVAVRYPYEIDLVPGDEDKAIAAAEVILAGCMAFFNESQP